MTASQVATVVSRAFEANLTSGIDSVDTFRTRLGAVDLTGVTASDPGPFTVVNVRAGDDVSEFSLPGFRPAYRSLNNNFEGVYIDDFVIGVAERGEAVTNAPADTTFTTVAGAGQLG